MNHRNTIQVLGFLCIALFLTRCAREVPVSEQGANVKVVECMLEVGEPITDFHIHGLRGVGVDQAHANLRVEVNSNAGSVVLSPIPEHPGFYEGPSAYSVAPETDYYLSIYTDDNTITAQAQTPPNMSELSSSKSFIDAHVESDLVFLEWTGVNTGSFNEYFYVIELLPLDENASEIERSLESQSPTTTLISYTSELTLSIEDFNFYGLHSIRVSALSKDYEALFSPQESSFQNGPTNIQNGYGYFLGTSSIDGTIEVR